MSRVECTMGGEEEGVVCTRATSGLLQFSIRHPPLQPRSKQLKFSLMSSSEIIQNSELQVYERALYKVGFVLQKLVGGCFLLCEQGGSERSREYAERHSGQFVLVEFSRSLVPIPMA